MPDIETLLQHLIDPDPSKRASASIALSGVKEARVSIAFARVLNDPDPTVRANAVTNLGINKALDFQEAVLVMMRDPNEIVRERTATALARMGTEEAVLALIEGLEDTHTFVRNRCAYLLGASHDPQAIDPLTELLDHRDPTTRSVAAWALGALRAKSALPALKRLLTDKEASVRGNAAWALGEFADDSLISPLIDLLKDKNPDVRAKTAWALGASASETSNHHPVKPLIRSLEDYSEVQDQSAYVFVCQYAAEALTQIGTPEALEAVEHWRPLAQERLLPYRTREMIRALIHPTDATREEAVEALIGEGHGVIEELLQALKQRNPRMRGQVVRTLGLIGSGRAVAPLIATLADEDMGVWSQSVGALSRIRDGVSTLKNAQNSPQRLVKLGVAIALWRKTRDEEAFPYVLIGVQDADILVQSSAVTSFWSQPDERAIATLQGVLTDEDTMLNRYIIRALQAINTPLTLGIIQRWLTAIGQ